MMYLIQKTGFILLAIVSFQVVAAQSETGDIESYLGDAIDNLPGRDSEEYMSPSLAELTTWENALTALLNGDIPNSRMEANSLNYEVVEYTDTSLVPNQIFYLIQEKMPQNKYWGNYVVNLSACRDQLILQAPHPKYDLNTAKEAVFCFKRLSAKALMLSGTHRCNHSLESSCSGTTAACSSSSGSYKISDMAHNTATIFQKTTEVLASEIPASVFVQLHGFSKSSTDPFLIISNGTRETPPTDYAKLIADELLKVDGLLTAKLPHIDLTWTRLIAFTNTQGRFLNGSNAPCNTATNTGSGRFVHIEQEKTQLRDNATGWNKMYMALSNAFTCMALPIEKEWAEKTDYSIFPNPTHQLLSINAPFIEHIQLVNMNGQVVVAKKYKGIPTAQLPVESYPKGLYLLQIQTAASIIYERVQIE